MDLEQIERTMREMFAQGEPFNAMKNDERKKGYEIITPGDVDWLPLADWPKDIVISRFKHYIRIIAIRAINPHTGSFSRLITNIILAGFVPVVVEPMVDMRQVLTRWRWSQYHRGQGIDREEYWKPHFEFLQNRRNLAFKPTDDHEASNEDI